MKTRNDITELEPSGSHSGAQVARHGISQEGGRYAILLSLAMSAGIRAIQHSTSSRTSWLIRNPHELWDAQWVCCAAGELMGQGSNRGFSLFLCCEGMVGAVRWWLWRYPVGACQELLGLPFILPDEAISLRRETTCPWQGTESGEEMVGPTSSCSIGAG